MQKIHEIERKINEKRSFPHLPELHPAIKTQIPRNKNPISRVVTRDNPEQSGIQRVRSKKKIRTNLSRKTSRKIWPNSLTTKWFPCLVISIYIMKWNFLQLIFQKFLSAKSFSFVFFSRDQTLFYARFFFIHTRFYFRSEFIRL